jgi:hypothetical protein
MSKQTAVEWLVKKLTNRQNGIFDGFPHLSLDEIYSQAKAMEKEQYDIFDKYLEAEKHFGISDKKTIERVQWYYRTYFNETYGGDK